MARPPRAYKVTVMVPLADNHGHPFSLQTWTWWNEQLTSLLSGFTDTGVVTGWWRGQSDQNRAVVMIVRSMQEVAAIRRLVLEARTKFRQEAMYLEYHSVFFEEVR